MILEKLDRFINNESHFDARHYGLHDIIKILEHFGNPHRDVPAFHIAGTNGKGSVAHMLNKIFLKAGYRTGLYTSPHLLDINERIIIQDATINDELFGRYIDEIIEYTASDGSLAPTFFDVLTVCAFRYFSDCRADCAVIETGLGGRLDSTNVIAPLCAIITDISLDHMGILGNTLTAIAREKAGIIKEGIAVVTSNTGSDVLGPIIQKSSSHKARLYAYTKDFNALNSRETDLGYRFDYSLETASSVAIPDIELNHPLEKQIANSSCAITASVLTRRHFPELTDDAIRNGLNDFSAPGRFQTLCLKPLIIFDPAHNEAAMKEMIQLVMHRFPNRTATIVLSLMKDKDIAGIMSVLAVNGIKALYYILNDIRCFRPRQGDYPEVIMKSINSDEAGLFLELDRLASDDSIFFFTGSFRLYRTVLNYAGYICTKCC